MELFELFGKIAITGAEDANEKIEKLGNQTEKNAVKICNALKRIGNVPLNINGNLSFPNLNIRNTAEAIKQKLDNALGELEKPLNINSNMETREVYEKNYNESINKNIREESFSENLNIQKNVTEVNDKPIEQTFKNVADFMDKLDFGFPKVIDDSVKINAELGIPEFKSDNYFGNIADSFIKTVDFMQNIADKLTLKMLPKENNKKNYNKNERDLFADIPVNISYNSESDKVFEDVEKAVYDGISNIKDIYHEGFDGIYKKARSDWEKLKTIAYSGTTKMAEGVKKASSAVYASCNNISSGVLDRLDFDASGAGSFVMESYKNGIMQKAWDVYSAVMSISSNISAAMLQISVPDISTDVMLSTRPMPRYAKGGIVTREHIARVGEDGAEAIIPLERNTQWIDKVASRMSGNVSNAEVVSRLDRLIALFENQGIYLDSGQLVGALAGKMDKKLGSMARLKRRGI